MRDKSHKIITKIAHCLIKTTVEEAKLAKTKQKKKADYFSDSDFSDDFSESDESDFSEDEEESKRRHENMLSLIDEDDNAEEDKGDSTDSEGENTSTLESEIDVQSNFSVMKSGFNSFDEFNYFKFVWKQLSQNHPQEMQELANQLSEKTQKAIRNLCQVKHFEKNGRVVHRRIIKGKRRTQL